ncbi:MAG TPA: ATP-binding protein [Jatrophihabitans sp.]|jgi:signal transduction histidine kinase
MSALTGPGVRRLLWPVSVALATTGATAIGLVVAVLIHGQLPDGAAAVPIVVGTVVAVVAGVLAAPALRELIRSAVPALRRAPSEISRRIAESAAQRLPIDELLLRAAEAMRTGLDSPRIEIWLTTQRDGLTRSVTLGVTDEAPQFSERDRTVISRIGVAGEGWAQRWVPQLVGPRDPYDTRRAPLRVAAITETGELLGMVVAGRRPGAARYDFDDDDSLAAACRLLAAILRNRRLTYALEESLADLRVTNDQLLRSRTRIVTAADAERRRIERNLHDGAQQHLLALAVTVGLVRQMVTEHESPEEIEAMLAQLGDDVAAAIGQVRELAQGIYPALLMDGGLQPALRAVAGRAPLAVQVRADGIGRYPPNLEAAVYFCVLEALQNAAKHAPGSTVDVELHESDASLQVAVRDDGPGFDLAVPSQGMGRTTMADRVGALGGTVRWESAPGAGTAVVVDVPIPAQEAAPEPERETA